MPSKLVQSVLSETVQQQRSIMGRVFRRSDRRYAKNAKNEFFAMIPGMRPDRTVQYCNAKELLLIWRALCPLMDNIPGSWEAMMENDPAKLAVLRDDLDRQLRMAVDTATATGRGLQLVDLKPSKSRQRSHSVPNRRSSRLRHPSASGMDLSKLPPRKPSGRKAAAAAAAAMTKFLRDDDIDVDDDEGGSTTTDNDVSGSDYDCDSDVGSPAIVHDWSERTPERTGAFPHHGAAGAAEEMPSLTLPLSVQEYATGPSVDAGPVQWHQAAASASYSHAHAPVSVPVLVPTHTHTYDHGHGVSHGHESHMRATTEAAANAATPTVVPMPSASAPPCPATLAHSLPPVASTATANTANGNQGDLTWLDDFDMDDMPEPADIVGALLEDSRWAHAPATHKAGTPSPSLTSLFQAVPPVMPVPAPRMGPSTAFLATAAGASLRNHRGG